MTPALLADLVRDTARDVLAGHGLDAAAVPADVGVRRPRDPDHGDWTTAVALRAAGPAGVPPRELAGWLAAALSHRDGIAVAESAGPGYVNLRLDPVTRAEVVAAVLAAGAVGAAVPVPDDRPIRLLGADTGADPGVDPASLVGPDTVRYLRARTPPGETPVLDPAVHGRRIAANPLFRVQFAHARLAGLARHAADLRITPDPGPDGTRLLTDPAEAALIGLLVRYPEVTAAGGTGAAHRIARHLEALADAAHSVLDRCPALPMGEHPVTPTHRARLALAAAARRVLAAGLTALGVDAPEQL